MKTGQPPGEGIAWELQARPVCAQDFSLRLKSDCAQDDAAKNRNRRNSNCTTTSPRACLSPEHCLESNKDPRLKRSPVGVLKLCSYETHTTCKIRAGIRRRILLLHHLAFELAVELPASLGLVESSHAG